MLSPHGSAHQKLSKRKIFQVLLTSLLLALLFPTLLISTGCDTDNVYRASMTPAPEEAKGVMYIASDKPVAVKASNVFVVAKKHMIGTIQDDVSVNVKMRGTDVVNKWSLKGKILVDEAVLDVKGYSETIETNKKIRIGVEGTTVISEKDVFGYYLVHKDDLKVLIAKAKTNDAR